MATQKQIENAVGIIDNLLSVPQAAKMLGVSRQRVNVYIQRNQLRAVKIDGVFKINPADLTKIKSLPIGRPCKPDE